VRSSFDPENQGVFLNLPTQLELWTHLNYGLVCILGLHHNLGEKQNSDQQGKDGYETNPWMRKYQGFYKYQGFHRDDGQC
jgi:hypothetical protein